jgi:hypothetical protein
VDGGTELPSGSEEEVEIRAASILAVEQLKQAANAQLAGAQQQLLSIQLDWWLWHEGEKRRSEQTHHRTRTIYY